MRRSLVRELFVCLTALTSSLLGSAAQAQSAMGSAFTYQGRLNDEGSAATGLYDLRFSLYDAAKRGLAAGKTVSLEDVEVQNGLFTVELDFGTSAFDGKARFLEVAVRPGDSEGEYTNLEPRQPLTPAPYALFALRAPSSGATGKPDPEPADDPNNPHDHWNDTWTGSGVGLTLDSADDTALYAQTDQAYPAPNLGSESAVVGEATATTGYTYGVSGLARSPEGIGMVGGNSASSGPAYGVSGGSFSSEGVGVYGTSWSGPYSPNRTTGTGYGVRGRSTWTSGRGVFGEASATTGTNYGLYGTSASSSGTGVYGSATATTGTTGTTYGVYGTSASSSGTGVYGSATATTGTTGTTYGVYGYSASNPGVGVYGGATDPNGTTYGVLGGSASSSGTGVAGYNDAASGATRGVYGRSASATGFGVYAYNSGSGVGLYARSVSGNLLEGFGSSAADREFYVSNTGNVYADGVYNSNGADFAELLPAAAGLEPGDVLAAGRDGKLRRSTAAFQTSVLGVYSTQPGFLGGSGDASAAEGKVPLAVLGIVPVKASAENGPIQTGDLLVASSAPGYAMAAGKNPPPGSVLGKALQELDRGTGTIRMLVTLQ